MSRIMGTSGKPAQDIPLTTGPPPGAGKVQVVASGNELALERNVRIPMRDGVRIAADIYRPRKPGRHPTLLVASAYPKKLDYLPSHPAFRFRETSDFEWWVKHGYAIVRTDARGTGESTEGVWDFFGPVEQNDLYDTVEWAARQPWSLGRVGMLGQSYYAMVQWLAAACRPPSLAGIAPYDGLIDMYRDWSWHGGLFSEDFVTRWSMRQIELNNLPFEASPPANVMAINLPRELYRRRFDDDFYRERSAFWRLKDIQVPVYSIGAWEKVRLHTRGNLLGFENVAQVPRKLLMVAGDAQATFHTEALMLELKRWYDWCVGGKDNGIDREPPVKIYVQGKNPGFRFEQEWPLARARITELHLTAQGLSQQPAPAEGTRSIDYPPADYLRDLGSARFESAPLDADTEVTGPVKLVLYVSSDQRDADIVVTLGERDESGLTVITRGWQKASHRALDPALSTPLRPFHPHQREDALEPGKVYEVAIEIWPTAWNFAKGSRIVLDIANGDRTHFYGFKAGRDTYHFGGRHPSRLILPVIPGRG